MTTDQAKLEEIGIIISNPYANYTVEELKEIIMIVLNYDKEITEDFPYLKWAAKLQQKISPPPKDLNVTFYQPDSDAAKFLMDYLDEEDNDSEK